MRGASARARARARALPPRPPPPAREGQRWVAWRVAAGRRPRRSRGQRGPMGPRGRSGARARARPKKSTHTRAQNRWCRAVAARQRGRSVEDASRAYRLEVCRARCPGKGRGARRDAACWPHARRHAFGVVPRLSEWDAARGGARREAGTCHRARHSHTTLSRVCHAMRGGTGVVLVFAASAFDEAARVRSCRVRAREERRRARASDAVTLTPPRTPPVLTERHPLPGGGALREGELRGRVHQQLRAG